jgi:guanidinopropionase
VRISSRVQVGVRGHPRTLDWLEPSYDLGYEFIDIERYGEIGTDGATKIILECLADKPVCITFDLDCLEGLKINETMKMPRSVKDLNIIGDDVVCLMPTKDSPNK